MATSLGSGYLLHEALGRGAMGQVFAGTSRRTGQPVAVKVLRPELVSDPDVVARFVQERTILMSIADPNVVRVIDLVVEGETLAIVMELVRGTDLRRHLRERRTLPPAEALRLTGQLLRGMAAVHAAGIIHRDIKPENMLFDTSGGRPLLKLTDFGVARLSYGASLTKLSGLIGTPEYMAPELAEHNRATPAADVYSAGAVLYEMLCGRTPFAGGHPLAVLRRHVDQAPPPIPGVPAELWERIAWMLAKSPAARPASAAEAAAALLPLAPSLAVLPALPPWAGPETGTPDHASPSAEPVGPRVSAKAAENATVLRYRDRGGAAPGAPAVPDEPAGRVPRPRGRRSMLTGTRSQRARRKRQVRVAVLAACLAAVIALVTTVAMAATHKPTSLRPAAARRTATPRITMSPATAQSATVSPPPASVSPPPAAVSPTTAPSVAASSVAAQPVTQPTAVTTLTVTPTAATPPTAAPQSSSPSSPSLSAAEQQLADMLNHNALSYCTARADLESGIVLAAVNCAYQGTGPTKNPLAEMLASGYSGTWFNNNTNGFTNSNDCAGGEYLGIWRHNGVDFGQLGCTVESNGLLRIVWNVNNQVGIIAEGSDHQALYSWWEAHGCTLPAAC